MESTATRVELQVEISYRQILKLALPIAAASIVPQIQFITNSVFLGRLSEQALAVAGITGVYYLLFAVIGFGLNNGLQVLIARRAGESRAEEVGKLFHQGVYVSIVIAFIGITFTYFVAPVLLRLTLHHPENVEAAMNFLRIRIWGLPIMYIYQMRNALLIGINQSRFLIIGALAESITNIVWDYGLIYGKFGLPALGFNGAAYASIIAEIVGLFAILMVMSRKGVGAQLKLFKRAYFDHTRAMMVLNQAFPLILQLTISVITWNLFYILIEHHGERSLAISNAMRNIFGLFGFVTGSMGAVSNSMVSNVIGQGKSEKVLPLLKMILGLSLCFSLPICLILNLFPEIFLKVYGQGDDFIQEAIPVVRVVSSALVLASLATVWMNAIVGTGNSRVLLFIQMGAIVLYSVYTYVALEMLKTSLAIGWMSEWVFWIATLVPSYIYMQSGKWKGRKI